MGDKTASTPLLSDYKTKCLPTTSYWNDKLYKASCDQLSAVWQTK